MNKMPSIIILFSLLSYFEVKYLGVKIFGYFTPSIGHNIFCCVIDGKSSSCVMSLDYWKALGFTEFVPFSTMLKAFDGNSLSVMESSPPS